MRRTKACMNRAAWAMAATLVMACGAEAARAEVPATAATIASRTPLVLAQQDRSQNQSSSSSRVRTRGVAKLVKLGIGGVVLLVAGGAWVAKKMSGGSGGDGPAENPFGPDAQNRR